MDAVAEILAAAPHPLLVIDTSTCPPQDARRRTDALSGRGHVLVDAPVSGGPSGAREGALNVFLGCPAEHLELVRAALEPIASGVHHVGPSGAGATAKLMNNLLCGIHLCAARALLDGATAAGVDAEPLVAAINGASGRSAVTEVNLPRWVLSDAFDSGFPVGLMQRDVRLAAEMLSRDGNATPVVEAAAAMWEGLLESGGARADFNRMVTGS